MVNEDDSDGSSASQTSTTGELSLNEICLLYTSRERIGRFKYTPIGNVDAAYEETRRALAKEIADLHQKEDF